MSLHRSRLTPVRYTDTRSFFRWPQHMQITCWLILKKLYLDVPSNLFNDYPLRPTKDWTNRWIETLTSIFYLTSTEMGLAKTWTNNRIEPLSGDPLGGLDCKINVIGQNSRALLYMYRHTESPFCQVGQGGSGARARVRSSYIQPQVVCCWFDGRVHRRVTQSVTCELKSIHVEGKADIGKPNTIAPAKKPCGTGIFPS